LSKGASTEPYRSEVVYSGRVVTLRVDEYHGANGGSYKREVVVHKGAVVMVPLDSDGNVHLVRQYRAPVSRVLLELPAGTLDHGDEEAPEACAERELQEEIGQRAGKLERLGGFYSAPGFCTEYLHVFLATELSPAHLAGDEDEDIEVVRLPLAEVRRRARAGEFEDAKTLAALFFLGERGLLPNDG
jgi:ADP-ribose pyrophosphatase